MRTASTRGRNRRRLLRGLPGDPYQNRRIPATRRLGLERLEDRRLLSVEPFSGPPAIFYDYVEDGVLKGGRLEVDPTDPYHAAVDSPEPAAPWNHAEASR